MWYLLADGCEHSCCIIHGIHDGPVVNGVAKGDDGRRVINRGMEKKDINCFP